MDVTIYARTIRLDGPEELPTFRTAEVTFEVDSELGRHEFRVRVPVDRGEQLTLDDALQKARTTVRAFAASLAQEASRDEPLSLINPM